jgi:thioesterase domain-containing protein
MMDRIERACGVRLPLSALFAGATVKHLAGAVLDANAERFRSPLVTVQAGASATPFFFLHGDYNGGGFYCRKLAQHLGSQHTFLVIQPHGLDGEPIPERIEAMAADRLRVLLEHRPAGPYRLGGHCNGELVALEMARRLQAMGSIVELLVVIDASASNARYRWLWRLVDALGAALRRGPRERTEWFIGARNAVQDLEALTRDKSAARVVVRKVKNRLARLAARGRRSTLDGAPARGGADSSDKDRAYSRALDVYVPRPYRGRVVFLRTDSMLSRTPGDPTVGWRHVTPSVELHPIPGLHVTCLTEHVEPLARELASCLGADGR